MLILNFDLVHSRRSLTQMTEKKDEKPQEVPEPAKVEDEKPDGSESSSDDDAADVEVRICFATICFFLCVWFFLWVVFLFGNCSLLFVFVTSNANF